LSLFVLAVSLLAQEMPVPAAPESGPEVRLELRDGKSQFDIGERIEFDLVFCNTTSDPYMLNDILYGDIVDKVEIAPASGWMEWWPSPSGHGYVHLTTLGPTEVRVPIVLNEGFVFRDPGHYEIRITTNRLRGGGDLLHLKSGGPVTTNAVGIDLMPMPADVEAEQAKSLMSQMDSAPTYTRAGSRARQEAVSRLADLQGDDALRAKVRLILAEDADMRRVTREALASTRNLPLQLSLLEAAWNDPAIPPVGDLPDALQETRALMRGQMAGPPADPDKAAKAAEEHKADMEALLRSLPMRSGQSRADAAFYLMDDRSLPPADIAAAKPVALEEFASMDDCARHLLLELRWPAIRDASLTPVLRAMLDQSPTDSDAIERLIELDPEGARDYVVRAVCDRGRSVVKLPDAVGALPDATLPEVDGCLGDLLRVPPPSPTDPFWKARAELAARFASPAILPAVRQGWTDAAQDAAVLPLLLRYVPAEAVSRIERSQLQGINLYFETNKVFKARRASFPAQLTDLLRHQVQSGPEDQAGWAAYELSQGGAPDDRSLLEQRLAKLRAEWSSRLDDVASAAPGSPAYKARALDVELMSDLREAAVWTLSDADAAQLALGCLSDRCRQYGKPRRDDQNNPAN
jgi:hypothetical protein